MATLSILKPSVNNLTPGSSSAPPGSTATRSMSGGRGRRRSSSPRTPPASRRCWRRKGSRRARCGRAARSCSTSEPPRARGASTPPTRPSGPRSTARCSISSGRCIRCSRARPIRPSGSRSTPARWAVGRGRRAEGEGPAGRRGRARRPARGLPRVLPRRQPVHRRRAPTIADIRFAASLEFLRAIDYAFPAWAEEYMGAMEEALGEAYSEPAADVRGYVDYVKGQSVT